MIAVCSSLKLISLWNLIETSILLSEPDTPRKHGVPKANKYVRERMAISVLQSYSIRKSKYSI